MIDRREVNAPHEEAKVPALKEQVGPQSREDALLVVAMKIPIKVVGKMLAHSESAMIVMYLRREEPQDHADRPDRRGQPEGRIEEVPPEVMIAGVRPRVRIREVLPEVRVGMTAVDLRRVVPEDRRSLGKREAAMNAPSVKVIRYPAVPSAKESAATASVFRTRRTMA